MDIKNLEKILSGEAEFRIRQAKEALFKKFISSWQEATFFTKDLRERLEKEFPIDIKADVLVSRSKDSVKAKIELYDGLQVESVLMRHKDGRNTVCVSSQVGCPLGCLFCATGRMGFKRNLSPEEILKQVLFFCRHLKPSGERVTNVAFMGMGEPLLNYENVMEAVKVLNSKDYFGIGARSISISTAGITEGMERLSNEGLPLNLAISLHAPNDALRKSLMPIANKYPLAKVFQAVDFFIKKTNRKVMFEYILIDGVNDSAECAKELAKMMSKKLYFVNLILYNPTPKTGFKPSSLAKVQAFKKILQKEKINFVQRYRFGDDIKAACGQFAAESSK